MDAEKEDSPSIVDARSDRLARFRGAHRMIIDGVKKGGKIYSDSLPAYKSLPTLDFVHETVNHVNS